MKRKQAFTLIEILIVLVIVGLLALIALANFSAARQRARMDIAADALVSVFKQQQSLVRSGRGAAPTCYGIYFNPADPVQVYTVEAPYISVDSSVDVTRADFCDMRQGKFQITRLEAFEDNKITKLNKFGMPVPELMVLFRPPGARVLVGDMGFLESPQVTDNAAIMVVFQSASGQHSRAVRLDVSSGLAERIPVPVEVKPIPVEIKPIKSPSSPIPVKTPLTPAVTPVLIPITP